MALITCPDCGEGVSTAAVACPHCGRPSGPDAGPDTRAQRSGCRGLGRLAVLACIGGALVQWSGSSFDATAPGVTPLARSEVLAPSEPSPGPGVPPMLPFHEVGADPFQHFVIVSTQTAHDRDLVLRIARQVCGDQRICFAHFWTSARRAGTRIPMTDAQVTALVASYNRNRNTGNDAFQCYNFGAPGEHC